MSPNAVFLRREWKFPISRTGMALVWPLLGLFALSSCSTVKVKHSPEQEAQSGIESANLLGKVAAAPFTAISRFAENCSELLKNAKKQDLRGEKRNAAGTYLKAAVDSRVLLVSGTEVPGSEAENAIMDLHNSALASFAELWIEDPRRFVEGSCRFAYGSETLEVDVAADSAYTKDFFDHFISVKSLEKKGIVSLTRSGYGAAMVGIRELRPDRAEELRFFPGRGVNVPVTLTIDTVSKAEGNGDVTKVSLSIRNPLVQESVPSGARQLRLAVDYSAPLAVVLRGGNEVLAGLHGFFKAEERLRHSGILLLEPYDPNRIPVILIHGLFSVPIIWRDIIPHMTSDPEISKRYQFMLFTYPSSFPVIESAGLLRDQISALRAHFDPDGNDPLSRNLVVAGHSMGGILTHSLIADFGDNLWKEYSDVPLEEMQADASEKEKMRKLVYFEPDKGVSRAIYFSTPHRGSDMARKGIAGVISRTAKLPGNVLQITTNFLSPRIESNLKVPMKDKVTSVQSLQPGAPMISAMDASPYKEGVRFHSVIGDRGKGDTPESSDGIVEYWSSRQEGATSELIVPSDHKSYRHPLGIQELRRILREHAGVR